MAESNGQDVQVPWFSGLCLEGEVAGQYEIERPGSQQEVQDTTKAGVLELDGLAPITIFVGANNSGKSRLLRELFGNSEATKCIRIGPAHEMKLGFKKMIALIQSLETFQPGDKNGLGEVIAAVEKFLTDYRDWKHEAHHGWTGLKAVSLFDEINSRIEPYLRSRTTKPMARSYLAFWPSDYEALRQSQFCKRADNYLALRRCYVPMLRGMRPPLASVISDRQGIDATDCYEKRSILDYFDELPNWCRSDGVEEDMSRRIQHGQAPVFSDKPRIFTGLSLYHDIRKRLLAPTHEERKSIREYETFLSVNFFQDREVTLTPAERNQAGKDNDVVHIKIGESEDRPIYALGDGMQSLIICTYPIITELQQGSLFFLEEPDLCMHPSLQRVFLKVLRESYTEKGHQFFLTTHSNHLLDLLEDNELVSIFSFSEIADQTPARADSSQADSGSNPQQSKPKPSFRIRPSNLTDRRTLLELGVRPSATYLANATIWVEGVSDCAYLRAYMEAFVHYLKIRGNDWGKNGINGKSLAQRLEEYKEDRHYAFVEYSGSNLEHYSFTDKGEDSEQAEVKSNEVTSVKNLCATALVIADGDVHDKGNRKIWFEDQLKERFICLPCKEIENLIPELLMKQQIIYDHTKPKQGDVPKDAINSIDYASYARSKNGIGAYLSSEDKKISKYQGKPGEGRDSGTLPPRYKTRWRSEIEGIPALLRKAINPESSANKPEQNDITESPVNLGVSIEEAHVPDYLTHDLIWLCVCIYSHVAKCNHDKESEEALNGFQQFIRDQGKESQGYPEGSNGDNLSSAESDDPSVYTAPEWPIKNVSSRNCLLKAFLRSNNAESTPSLSAEPNSASTPSAPGAIASPASLTP